MKKTLDQMIKDKYGIEILIKEEYINLKESVLVATKLEGVDFKGTMMMREKIAKTISRVTNVKMEVLDCLTIQNIEDMFNDSRDYRDIQYALIDLIKIYNASKKVGAQNYYSVVATSRWSEEYDYWIWEEDNEEEMEHINSYKHIREYGMFKYTCHVDIIL